MIIKITLSNDDTAEVLDTFVTEETLKDIIHVLEHKLSCYGTREELDESNQGEDGC